MQEEGSDEAAIFPVALQIVKIVSSPLSYNRVRVHNVLKHVVTSKCVTNVLVIPTKEWTPLQLILHAPFLFKVYLNWSAYINL